MSDLIERLRKRGTLADDGYCSLDASGNYIGQPSSFLPDALCAEAADEIARLTAENAALREALIPFARLAEIAETFPRNWRRRCHLPDFQRALAAIDKPGGSDEPRY
jgi:hypothetical protein